MKPFLKTAEAAKLLGMTPRSVRKLVSLGRLAVHRRGRQRAGRVPMDRQRRCRTRRQCGNGIA